MNNDFVVVSSRIRLARNLKNFAFPSGNISYSIGDNVLDLVKGSVERNTELNFDELKDLTDLECKILKEKHLISKDLIKNKRFAGIALNDKETLCVMVNEEDHIRLQCILPNDDLTKAYSMISKIDDNITKELNIAFNSALGYLTACPTNLGTAMRASVMMFLPALSMDNSISNIISSLGKIGITIRGIYGENSEAEGYLYQVSNQTSLGNTEEEIIANVISAVKNIKELELTSRENLLKNNKDSIADSVFRAYGVLSNCYKMTSKEFMMLIGKVKLGQALGLLQFKNPNIIEELIEISTPAMLTKLSGKDLKGKELDYFRAKELTKLLKNMRK